MYCVYALIPYNWINCCKQDKLKQNWGKAKTKTNKNNKMNRNRKNWNKTNQSKQNNNKIKAFMNRNKWNSIFSDFYPFHLILNFSLFKGRMDNLFHHIAENYFEFFTHHCCRTYRHQHRSLIRRLGPGQVNRCSPPISDDDRLSARSLRLPPCPLTAVRTHRWGQFR